MPGIILSCGAEDPLGEILQDEKPIQPQILPIPLDPPALAPKKRKRSNGCGTRVHFVAVVSPKNMWRAAEVWNLKEKLIVPLEDRYFSAADAKLLSLGWKPCGCVRSGVGCAVCGNPLGALFTPCPQHQDSKSGINYYTILPSAVSPPIPPYVPEPRPRVPWPFPVSRSPRTVRPLPTPGRASVPITLLDADSTSTITVLDSQGPGGSDDSDERAPSGSTNASRGGETRYRHPTSPPPRARIFAVFTPTPSPEAVPVALPGLDGELESGEVDDDADVVVSGLAFGWETVNAVGDSEDEDGQASGAGAAVSESGHGRA
ncbi:hypothetical protein C8R45DRAFT_191259 [Mycena sanguinolenta]|nr:hypothetical protein C8R45DRAFT_191259 [Mycena sanguinolenta]